MMKKKKGRPSLLDLQKRSLRLQKQHQNNTRNPSTNPNPKSRSHSPNPYLKFPSSSAPARRTTRRSSNPDDDDDEEESDGGGKRKEKKLKLVLQEEEEEEGGGSDSEEEGSSRRKKKKKRKIDSLETGGQKNSSSKATDARVEEDPSDSGPTAATTTTTPLPDKKLLEFILDRLHKKDTYSVFSEPVDPNELPDYHDIIQHPMDFATVRNKLSSGAYACLEQFESDVFLISSNAMHYNAPDTIYYRQARSIQELAKKDFKSLRQESDNETEPQTVRRGRPPMKNTIKRMLAKTPADRTVCDVSNATLSNSRDDARSNSTNGILRKGSSFDKMNMVDSSTTHTLCYNQTHRSNGDQKSEYLGFSLKGISMRNWKKQSVTDENRRDTYNQPLRPTFQQKQSILNIFDLERKLLEPVSFHADHSYARSLARFAANLGPVGWEIAAKKVQRALPPGTKFGRGWVGDSESPQPQPPVLSASPQVSTQMKLLRGSTPSSGNKPMEIHEPSPNDLAPPLSASGSAAPTPSRSLDSMDGPEACKIVNPGGKLDLVESGAGSKNPIQLFKNSPLRSSMNCFNPGFGVSLPSQAGKSVILTKPPEEVLAHARVRNMVCRNGDTSFVNHQAPLRQVAAEEKTRLAVGNPSTINSSNTTLHPNHHSEGKCRAVSMDPKPGSLPPDLNVDFQSPGSPVSSMLPEPRVQQQKQPDLALQL